MGTENYNAGSAPSRVVLVDGATGNDYTAAGAGTGPTALEVQGNIANDAVDSGKPVKIGVKAQSGTPVPVSAALDRADVLGNLDGSISICAYDGQAGAGADGRTSLLGFSGRAGFSLNAWPVAVGGFVYNNTSWDRQRGDVNGQWAKEPPLAKTDSAVTAASTTSQQLFAASATRAKLIIQNQDAAINVFVNIGATAVAGANNLRIAPGATLELAGTTGAVNIIAASGAPAICAWQF